MKAFFKAPSSFTFAVALVAPPAAAHHGKDFFTVASSRLPHPHQWFTVLSMDYTKSLSAFSLEPGLLYGVNQYWSAEAHVHLEQSGRSLVWSPSGLSNGFSCGSGRKQARVQLNGRARRSDFSSKLRKV